MRGGGAPGRGGCFEGSAGMRRENGAEGVGGCLIIFNVNLPPLPRVRERGGDAARAGSVLLS